MERLSLIADIGGTNARFALTLDGQAFSDLAVMDAAHYPRIEDALRDYLSLTGARLDAAVIAGAGPVTGQGIDLTNSPWRIEAASLKAALGCERIRLLNDFEALAHALPALGAEDCERFGGGAPGSGPRLVLGPGTGFGAALYFDAQRLVVPAEGGHAALGVSDIPGFPGELETGPHEGGRISIESILSGRGLTYLYRTLASRAGAQGSPISPADIVARAPAGLDAAAVEAVGIFASALGSAAGDLALATGATGGVFIAGGIAPRLLSLLRSGDFRQRFDAKAPLESYMREIPLAVITHPQPAMLGLARLAAR